MKLAAVFIGTKVRVVLDLSHCKYARTSAGRGLLGKSVHPVWLDDPEVFALLFGRLSAQVVLWRRIMSIGAEHAQQGGDGDGEQEKRPKSSSKTLTTDRVEHQALAQPSCTLSHLEVPKLSS